MKKPPGDDVSATITALRAQIAALQAEIASLAAAPVPLDESEAAVIAAVDQLGALYDPSAVVAAFTRPGGADLRVLELVVPDADNPQQRAAYECSVHRTDVLALLLGRLRETYSADPALRAATVPLRDRPARAAALRATLRELEVAEELRICEAERSGHVIDRRPDVDVSIVFDAEVLGVEDAPAA